MRIPASQLSDDEFVSESIDRARAARERRASRRTTPSAFKKISEDAKARLALYRAGDRTSFDGAKPVVFVALYAILHEKVYGAAPVELLEGSKLVAAASAARKLFTAEFGEKPVLMIEFLRWVWSREALFECRRRDNGSVSDFRISWHHQFVARSLLTDFRVSLLRKRGRK